MATSKRDSKDAIERRKQKYKQEKDQLYLIENKLNAILDYFKLLYISDLTAGRSTSGFKLLYGDSLLKKVFDDEKKKYISLNATNYMLIQDLQIYTSKMLLGNRKVNNIFGDLEWVNEIIDLIKADEKALDTIANFIPLDIYNDALEYHYELPMPKERIMQKRLSEVCKIVKNEENS